MRKVLASMADALYKRGMHVYEKAEVYRSRMVDNYKKASVVIWNYFVLIVCCVRVFVLLALYALIACVYNLLYK